MIGDVLKRMRIIYGYKASEMSSELGISASYLSEIENNKKQPSLDLLQKYADIYGIRLSSLILLSENMDEAPLLPFPILLSPDPAQPLPAHRSGPDP